ncbi:LytR family transcriptional regulator [Ornithinimicrobium ciconiae]|uniref:LytR family transcriptional regulator n=1 Tax=Ornithinimicrobium ciconiae TaxID=2594265 RepID=A0A516G7J7_9MICO|nr:LytR C-terminal domain-containing protein [Ornithinimicrobium ciconiae]QDO87489.1 LytR family transcriptional regulator [Ornithinimicrobium ciconiae]
MGYVRTAGMSTAARRRRRRAALVLSALLLLLVGIGGYAVAYYQGWLPEGDGVAGDADATTATAEVPAVLAEDVTVNVYNASGAAGIAGNTAKALATHGFDIDAVDNAPSGTETPAVAEIHHGVEGLQDAELLATYVEGAVLVEDARQIDEIDLYIGTDFVPVESAPDDGATSTG